LAQVAQVAQVMPALHQRKTELALVFQHLALLVVVVVVVQMPAMVVRVVALGLPVLLEQEFLDKVLMVD
jgi:hypothetical protein